MTNYQLRIEVGDDLYSQPVEAISDKQAIEKAQIIMQDHADGYHATMAGPEDTEPTPIRYKLYVLCDETLSECILSDRVMMRIKPGVAVQ